MTEREEIILLTAGLFWGLMVGVGLTVGVGVVGWLVFVGSTPPILSRPTPCPLASVWLRRPRSPAASFMLPTDRARSWRRW